MNYIKTNCLTNKQKEEIDHLFEICKAHDGLVKKPLTTTEFNVNKEAPCFLLAIEENIIVGYMFLFIVEQNEAEVYCFVSPDKRRQGVFSQLESMANDVFAEIGITRIVYAVERYKNCHISKNPNGVTFLRSEFGMRATRGIESKTNLLKYSQIVLDDEEGILHAIKIVSDAFEENCEEFVRMSVAAQNTPTKVYLFTYDGVPVGSVSVGYEFPQALIYGLAVSKSFQGKGFGREILTKSVAVSQKPNYNIELEVVAENEKALKLYTSCGFEQIYQIDYYLEEKNCDK